MENLTFDWLHVDAVKGIGLEGKHVIMHLIGTWNENIVFSCYHL